MTDPQLASPPPTHSTISVPGSMEIIQLSQSPAPPDIDQALREAEGQANGGPVVSKPVHPCNLFHGDIYKTEVTLEHGKDLKQKRILHLELLCSCSEKMVALFIKAQKLRELYSRSSVLRKEVKSSVCDDAPEDAVEHASYIMRLVHQCVKQYPLSHHQAAINLAITQCADRLCKDTRAVKGGSGNTSVRKKDFKDWHLPDRLQQLNPDGVRSVARTLLKTLQAIKVTEIRRAQSNPATAAAQRRILLPQFENKAVVSVVNWLYSQGATLQWDSADHLCKIYALAEELGIETLAAACMRTLLFTTSSAIDQANAAGRGVRELLEEAGLNREEVGGGQLAHIVPTVFSYVLGEDNPPTALRDLVINAIADSHDIEVFNMVKGVIDLPMALQLSEAMIIRACSRIQQPGTVKTETHDENKVPIKPDVMETDTPAVSHALNNPGSLHTEH
ncbi:hypothetical protein K491DRAFT_717880 [Lophiostoma macrostomum CBS 122681]|uniref:BTB domain-containing protein n=1 Tax=Lophiostoma macrostomum CBS 122681 TaxID=1314788 RepID=A0A6A6T0Z8_9PLEO|nr:hypothetical protein K491DRAFT_717880 [Lophiostoma macrostomum CBS 122681]